MERVDQIEEDDTMGDQSTKQHSDHIQTSAQKQPDGKLLDYLKEEQKQRRQEIENVISRIEADFRFAIFITGGIWSWFATNLDKLAGTFDKVVVFLPLFFAVFFWFRTHTIRRSIHTIAEYMRAVESKFGAASDGLGWETWLEAKRKAKDPQGKGYLARTANLYWLSLVAANLALTLVFAFSRGWWQ